MPALCIIFNIQFEAGVERRHVHGMDGLGKVPENGGIMDGQAIMAICQDYSGELIERSKQ